ncbi:MAG: hypothetical protein WA005_01510 [Candidatus Binataceae bacterium]
MTPRERTPHRGREPLECPANLDALLVLRDKVAAQKLGDCLPSLSFGFRRFRRGALLKLGLPCDGG